MLVELIKSLVFGIVEGITEWLPISSTGHMILLRDFIKFNGVSNPFWAMFEVVIQLGAILAVVILFWDKFWPFSANKREHYVKVDKWILWAKILIACVPAAIVGLLFDDQLNDMFYHSVPVSIALIVVGILFIVVEIAFKKKTPETTSLEDITFMQAIIIGLYQVLAAVFPGTSRSGATIIGGLMLGMSRTVAAEFTFVLSIPVMFGASLLKLVKFGFDFTSLEVAILMVGMIVAFVVSVICIKFLMDFIKRHNFVVFGWYRIALGALVLGLYYFGVVKGV